MTQEEKDLLLKDLCGRLSYGVKCKLWSGDNECAAITEPLKIGGLDAFMCNISITIKPYLRPMSSMTEEERKEYESFIVHRKHVNVQGQEWDIDCFSFDSVPRLISWLNAHHFDYRGLIEKGLALEAPEYMYKEV